MERAARFDRVERITRVSLWANLSLMAFKLTAGVAGGSPAVVADGAESGADLLAVAVSMVAVKVAGRPLDATHPYGHGRAEHLSSLLVSILIVLSGAGILWDAVTRIATGDLPHPLPLTAGAAAATILVKEILHRYTRRAAAGLESATLAAIADDHRKDALTSVATLAGVTGAIIGYRWADPAAALLSSLLIFRIGGRLFLSSTHVLMDGRPDPVLLGRIAAESESVPGVEHVHDIRARRSGQYLIVDLKLEMDPEMTVKQSHDVGDAVKERLFRLFPQVGDVMIHVNPRDEQHTDLIRL